VGITTSTQAATHLAQAIRRVSQVFLVRPGVRTPAALNQAQRRQQQRRDASLAERSVLLHDRPAQRQHLRWRQRCRSAAVLLAAADAERDGLLLLLLLLLVVMVVVVGLTGGVRGFSRKRRGKCEAGGVRRLLLLLRPAVSCAVVQRWLLVGRGRWPQQLLACRGAAAAVVVLVLVLVVAVVALIAAGAAAVVVVVVMLVVLHKQRQARRLWPQKPCLPGSRPVPCAHARQPGGVVC
jgi:hypothetical protein